MYHTFQVPNTMFHAVCCWWVSQADSSAHRAAVRAAPRIHTNADLYLQTCMATFPQCRKGNAVMSTYAHSFNCSVYVLLVHRWHGGKGAEITRIAATMCMPKFTAHHAGLAYTTSTSATTRSILISPSRANTLEKPSSFGHPTSCMLCMQKTQRCRF